MMPSRKSYSTEYQCCTCIRQSCRLELGLGLLGLAIWFLVAMGVANQRVPSIVPDWDAKQLADWFGIDSVPMGDRRNDRRRARAKGDPHSGRSRRR
jgi:hypothetical protein